MGVVGAVRGMAFRVERLLAVVNYHLSWEPPQKSRSECALYFSGDRKER
jgi:hypothetical protein